MIDPRLDACQPHNPRITISQPVQRAVNSLFTDAVPLADCLITVHRVRYGVKNDNGVSGVALVYFQQVGGNTGNSKVTVS